MLIIIFYERHANFHVSQVDNFAVLNTPEQRIKVH